MSEPDWHYVFCRSSASLATSQDRFKGAENKSGGCLFCASLLHSSLPPMGAMFHDPIEERFFKADIFAGFFALDPFMFQNLFALGQELLVEDGVLNEARCVFLCLGSRHVDSFFHKNENQSIQSE